LLFIEDCYDIVDTRASAVEMAVLLPHHFSCSLSSMIVVHSAIHARKRRSAPYLPSGSAL